MRRSTLLLLLSGLCIAGPVAAQPAAKRKGVAPAGAQATKDSLAGRLAALRRRVDELDKVRADVPALLEALQRVQREVSALARAVARRKKTRRGFLALRSRLDALDGRLDDLDLKITAVALRAGGGANAGYDRGFYLQTNDGKLRLRLEGLLQAEYVGLIASERRNFPGGRLGEHSSSFTLRRARLAADARLFDPRVHLQVGLEFGELATRPLLDAFGEFRWHRMLQVRLGLQRVPFGRQYALDLAGMHFRDRSPVTESFYPGRDIGLLVHGALVDSSRYGRLSYQLGVFNGGSTRGGFQDDNTDFLYAARVVYEPFGKLGTHESDTVFSERPKLALGGSIFYNLAPTDAAARAGETDTTKAAALRDQDRDGEVDNVGLLGLNAELTAHWRGIAWQNELFYRREDPGAVASARSFWGVYTQLAALHATGFELATRYGYWQVQRFGDDGTAVAPGKVHEVALALTAWLFERTVKLQASYAHRWLRDLADLRGNAPVDANAREHEFMVQAQLAF